MKRLRLIRAHVLDGLRSLRDDSVHCVVTSPPYWGLRDYGLQPVRWGDGWSGCLGLEPTPEKFVEHLARQGKPRNVPQIPNDWRGTELGGRGRSQHANPDHRDFSPVRSQA